MPTVTVYAGPGDGHIGGGSNTSWALARSQAAGDGGASTDYTTDNRPLLGWESNNAGDPKTYFIHRGFLPFDTSSLPDDAVITAATLYCYVTQKYSVSAGSCCLVAGTPASNTALVDDDFDQVGTTELASRKTYSGLTTSAYNSWALNADGLAAISKTGYTRFAFRTAKDLDNSAPSNAQYSGGYISTSEHTGTGQDPYLEITYYQPVSASDSFGASEGTASAAEPNLMSFWPLDEASGTNANDSAALNNDGTYAGSPTLGGEGPPGASAAVYLDSGDRVTFPNSASYRFTGNAAFTLEAWIKLDSVTAATTRAIVQQHDEIFTYAGWTLDVDTTGHLVLGRYGGASPYYTFTTSASVLPGAQWVHVAATYDGTDVRFYINGALDGSPQADSRSVASTTKDGVIGNYRSGYAPGDISLTGRIGRVRIYNAALSAAAILSHIGGWAGGETVSVSDSASLDNGQIPKSASESVTVADAAGETTLIGTTTPTWPLAALPHASAASVLKGSAGAWDDTWVYGATLALNSDGTPYVDGSGNYYVYYIGTGDLTSPGTSEDQTGLLLTRDFVTFTKHASNPVLGWGAGAYNDGSWDDTDVQIGAVIVHSGTFYAFYCGNNVAGPSSDFVRLGVATSSDGIVWTKHAGNPVLSQGSSGHGDVYDLYTAGAVLYDAAEPDSNKRWKWWYIGHGASGLGTMLATAPSPTGTWTKHSTAYLSGLEPQGAGGSTFSPGLTRVWKQNGAYHAIADDWYNLTQSYHFTSPDGLTWTQRAQVLAPGSSGSWDDANSYYPFPFQRSPGGPWTLLYTGSHVGTGSVVYGIGVIEFSDAGIERFTVSDSVTVTVGVGAITKTASDGFNVTDTSGGVTITFRKSASDAFTVSDSSGTSTTTDPVKYVTPCTANFVSASGHTASFVSASGHTARFVSSPAVTT